MFGVANTTNGGVFMNVATAMKSPVVKRSIVVAGHKTSVSLEDAFWKGLKEIAGGRDTTLSELVAAIDAQRQHGNLSSAIRLFVLDFYRTRAADLKEARDGAHDMLGVPTVPALVHA
jgi:predicted DNA-binding ribbon-helix-helix protein